MTPPVSPCGPLCASVAGEAESLLFPAGLRQREPVMGGIATQGFRPFWSGTEGRKKKQDKRRGRQWRLRPVTTARSAGSYGGFAVYQKWGQKQAAGITLAVTIPKPLLS